MISKELLHSNKYSTERDAAENKKMFDVVCNFSSKIAAIATKIRNIFASDSSVPLDHSTPTRFTGFVDISDEEAIRVLLGISVKTSLMDDGLHLSMNPQRWLGCIRPTNSAYPESIILTGEIPNDVQGRSGDAATKDS